MLKQNAVLGGADGMDADRAETALGLVLAALAFAAHKHRDQRRKDLNASPYINHPIALATLLSNEAKVSDPLVITSAILHDTVEDTDTTPQELQVQFGAAIAAIVMEVTDDKRLLKAERKRLQVETAPALSHQARLVKLADKICNLRDVHASPPADWNLQRRREYFDWAKAVIDRMRGTHAELERLFDAVYGKRP
ncbi:MAG: HD domain-containing protein [Acidobacteriales bacterium]|nr:HD domain-containing protein [Terriglobales bacterium]